MFSSSRRSDRPFSRTRCSNILAYLADYGVDVNAFEVFTGKPHLLEFRKHEEVLDDVDKPVGVPLYYLQVIEIIPFTPLIVSARPLMAVSGVLSSWETLLTKSRFIFQRFRMPVIS